MEILRIASKTSFIADAVYFQEFVFFRRSFFLHILCALLVENALKGGYVRYLPICAHLCSLYASHRSDSNLENDFSESGDLAVLVSL